MVNAPRAKMDVGKQAYLPTHYVLRRKAEKKMHACNRQPGRNWFAHLGAFMIVLIAFMLAPTAHAAPDATIVNQPILTNTTWTKAGSPYQVSNFIYVKSGVTLTVEPGVEVVFNQNSSFGVQGTLTALGSAADPILVYRRGKDARLVVGAECQQRAGHRTTSRSQSELCDG